MRKTQKAGSSANNRGRVWAGSGPGAGADNDISRNIAEARATLNTSVSIHGRYPWSNTTGRRVVEAVATSGFEELTNPVQIHPIGDRRRRRIERDQSYQFRKIILEAFMKRVNPRVAPSYRPKKFDTNRIIDNIIGGNLSKVMNNICTFKKPTSKLSRVKQKISAAAAAATKKMRGKSNVACAAGGVCSDISSYFKCDTEMLKNIIDIGLLKYSIKLRLLIKNNLKIKKKRITGMKDIKTSEHEEIISQSLSFVFYSEEEKEDIEDMLEGVEMAVEAERLQLIINTDTDASIRTRINRLMEGIPQEIYISNAELERRIRELHDFTQKPKTAGVRKRKKRKGKKSNKKKIKN